MPFYSQHQTINNNYLYFEGNDKNNNDITENEKVKNQNLNQSPIPIPQKPNFSEMENDETKSKKNEKSGQTTTKFFTDYGGYGYKCSCSKTQCNRYYCECYRSGLFCIDCNCKNCLNKPPENYVSNRHPTLSTTQTKTELVTCTCTKSGCNKKYCECYKNGTKCHSACRCVGCENTSYTLMDTLNLSFGRSLHTTFVPCRPLSSFMLLSMEPTYSGMRLCMPRPDDSP